VEGKTQEFENLLRGRERGGGTGRDCRHTWDKFEVKCYNCPNYGRYAYEYRENKNKAFLAKAIIEDDDESALL
jgi:hypothetical protein